MKRMPFFTLVVFQTILLAIAATYWTTWAFGQDATLVPVILPHEKPVVISRSQSQPRLARRISYPTSYWQWSPKAKYHDAIVHVMCQGRGGTGVVVYSEERIAYVLTAAHITMGASRAQVKWPKSPKPDQWGVGEVVREDRRNDIALIKQGITKPAIYVQVASEEPQDGMRLELAGFGGPADKLRHFYGPKVQESYDRSGALYANTNALQGDSGGPVFNTDAKVVGIIGGGKHVKSFGLVGYGGSDFPLHYPVRCCPVRPIQAMLSGFTWYPYTQLCPPGMPCFPRRYYRQPQIQVQPPQQQPEYLPPPTPDDEPVPTPDVKPPPQDNSKCIAELIERIKTDEDLQAVLKGKDGEPGKDGNPGQDATPIDADALIHAIVQKLKSDPEFIAAVTGPAGADGTNAEIDMAALAEALPPIHMDIMGKNGVHSSQKAKLGGRFAVPPVIITKIEDGQTFWQIKPLGESINLELVPVQ